MARPTKQGLNYYPLDTDFIHDIKVRKIMRSNGPQSIAVLLDLLGNIYGDRGYYMQWDDDVRFLVADDVGISEVAVDELIKKAVSVDFFNKELFDKFSILTSHGIQERYLKGAKRKVGLCIQKRYDLTVSAYKNPTSSGVNANNNPNKGGVSDDSYPQKKLKETKVNKNKVNKPTSKTEPEDLMLDFLDFWQAYPRKERKQQASDAYIAVREDGGDKEAILTGAVNYAKYVKLNNTGTGYIAMASKWLDEQRWTDEYDLTPVSSETGTDAGEPRTRKDWVG